MPKEPNKAAVDFVEGYNVMKDDRLAGYAVLAFKVRGEAQALAMPMIMLKELIHTSQKFLNIEDKKLSS